MVNPTAISFPLRRERLRKAALPVRLSCLGDTFPYPPCVISWHIKVASAARLVALIQRWTVLLYKQKGQFSLPFSPRGEAKCERGPSGRGASRLARGGVLDKYIEHGKQAQRSHGGLIACSDRQGGEKCRLGADGIRNSMPTPKCFAPERAAADTLSRLASESVR